MQSKRAGDTGKDAVRTICSAIFKVVEHESKKMDAKWTKRLAALEEKVDNLSSTTLK